MPRHLLIALFGPEYELCKTVELRSKGKYSVPVNITTSDAAGKVKESVKSKAEYQQIYFNLVDTDLIVSEFKLHKEPKNADQTCATLNRYYPR